MRWAVAILALLCAAGCDELAAQKAVSKGFAKDHETTGKGNAAAEGIAKRIICSSPLFKPLRTRSADLSDCLIWSGFDDESADVQAKHPSYYRPTDLEGWAVAVELDHDGDKVADLVMSAIVDADGNVKRTFPGSCVKFTGGKKARAAGRPTTSGIRPDADPLGDELRK